MKTLNSDRRALVKGAAAACALAGASLPWAACVAQTVAAAPAKLPPAIVLNSRDADVSLIDPVSYQVLGRVETGKEPHHLYPSPDNKMVLVGNAVSDSVTFLDPLTGKVLHSLQGIDDPYHLGFSPDQSIFLTCANRLNHIDLYRPGGAGQQFSLKRVARFDLAKTPSHLIFSGDSRIAYCTLQDSDELVAIDVKKMAVLWRFKVGRLPAGVAISPDSKLLFVGVMGDSVVQVIDPRPGTTEGPRIVAAIKTGEGAHAFRNQGNQRHLWVSNRVANTISKIDMSTLKVEAQIPVSGGPDCMEIDRSGRFLWVTQRWTRSVSVVDLVEGRVIKRVQVGRSPHGVYLHERAGLL